MKKVFLYILLAAGIILVIAGSCLAIYPPAKTVSETSVIFPKGSPVIALNDEQMMLNIVERIQVYEDGTVLNSISRRNMAAEYGPETVSRQWHLDEAALASIIDLFKNKFNELEDTYTFPELTAIEKDIAQIDQQITLAINIGNMTQQVKAWGYYLAYSSYIGPHHDIPEPLNELYQALNDIVAEYEKEYVQAVYDAHKNISDVLEITDYINGNKVILKPDDARFTRILTFLLNSEVQNVTHKTGLNVVHEQTTTVSVTVPYSLGYVLTFRPGETSEVKFIYSGTIWYESADNIYEVTCTTKLEDVLDEIMR